MQSCVTSKHRNNPLDDLCANVCVSIVDDFAAGAAFAPAEENAAASESPQLSVFG